MTSVPNMPGAFSVLLAVNTDQTLSDIFIYSLWGLNIAPVS